MIPGQNGFPSIVITQNYITSGTSDVMKLLFFTSSYIHWKVLSAATALHDDPEFSLEGSPSTKCMDPNWNVIQYPECASDKCSRMQLYIPSISHTGAMLSKVPFSFLGQYIEEICTCSLSKSQGRYCLLIPSHSAYAMHLNYITNSVLPSLTQDMPQRKLIMCPKEMVCKIFRLLLEVKNI